MGEVELLDGDRGVEVGLGDVSDETEWLRFIVGLGLVVYRDIDIL